MTNDVACVVVARRAPTPSIDIVAALLVAMAVVVVLLLHIG
jgi:hypothetical protein